MKTVRTIAYLIIIYVAAFMIWWMILLTRMEKENFELQKETIELKSSDKNIEQLEKEFKADKKQILYEGLVFLVLLAGSSFYVIRGINREKKFNELKRNFLLATTHELKTPLSATKLNLQTLLTRKINEDKQKKLMSNSLTEIERLNQLVNNILLASKIDATDYSFEKEAINLEKSLTKMVSSHPQKERIRLSTAENLMVFAEQSALEIVCQNLIDNALKYSADNTPIELVALKDGKNVVLQVKDKGIGIPTAERKKIFERFYRIEDEQTRKTKGTGLGLFLVKEMTKQMNGSIQVSDNEEKGSIFTLKLPNSNE